MPKGGRGEFNKMAQALRMHTTRVSQIFNGDMNLTVEQAADLCRYWGLAQSEAEFFLLLVQLERAGSQEARAIYKRQIDSTRARSKDLRERVSIERALSESERAIFYSSWFYSAARLLTSIEEFQTLDAISERLQQPRDRMREVLDFLVSTGLCIEEDGRYSMGPKTTHVEASSPLSLRHHSNWRLRAIQRQEKIGQNELTYTCPVSINRKDQAKLRELLIQTIQDFLKTVTESEPPEMVACLLIDWFEI